MQTECTPALFDFEPVERKKVVAGFDGGTRALLLGRLDRGLGLIPRMATCFTDRRDPGLLEHTVETLVGQRVFGLALGYDDLNDHDELRHDPVFAVLAGKLEAKRSGCAAVAGKSTLNRLEHTPKRDAEKYHKIDCDAARLEALFVDIFLDAHTRPPKEIVLDLDPTDDPIHGEQEGRFFHGYYDCYCYLPLYIFCGRFLLCAKLRPSNIDGAAGAVDEVARIVARIRARWPKVRIVLRGDSGFCREELMTWCEESGVGFVFGLAPNERLKAVLAPEAWEAERRCETTGKAARVFKDFAYRTEKTWSRARRVVGKAEHLPGGANLRFVVMRRGTPPAPADDQSQIPPPLLHNVVSTISRPGPWLMSICFALYTVQWMSLMVWLPTFLIEERTTGIGAAAAMTALVVVVNVAGNVGAGWMLRHNAPRWLLLVIAGTTMGLAGLGIFSSAVPDAARYLLCLVFSGVGGMLPTSLLSAVPVFAPSPRQYATGNGFLTQGANVGQVIGPPAVAALVASTGLWESASWLMAGTAGAIVVVALAIGAVERRLPAAGPAALPGQDLDSQASDQR